MINVAVIGVGMIGRNHARVYSELPECQLVAVSDSSPMGQELAARYQTAFEPDYKRMIDTYKPVAVSVCVPTVAHYDVVKYCLHQGVHVLVEKPITATIDQAREIIALAKEQNLHLAVGHIERFNPAVVELKKRLSEQELGVPLRIQSRRMGPFPERIRDVGVVVDLATHDADIVRYVLGTNITRVYAETAQGISTDREDIMDCVFHCENDVIGTFNINWLTPTKIRELSVTGSRGMFVVNYLTQELYFYENDSAPLSWDSLQVLTGMSEGSMTRLKVPRHEPLKAELQDFAHAVRDNRPPLVSGEDGMYALATALAIVKSGNKHEPIHIKHWLA